MSDEEDLPEGIRRDMKSNNNDIKTVDEIMKKNVAVTTRHGVVVLDSIYIDKMPKIYAKSLLELTAYVNKFLQTEQNIPSGTVKYLEDDINKLAERLMYLDASKGATYVEKKFISADLAKLAGSLLLMSPKLVEQLSSSSILIPFDELTSDPFWRMIEELRKENV